MTEAGFYFWRAALRRRRQEKAAARARKAKADAAAAAFVPVTVAEPPAMIETGQARIELALPSGAVPRLPLPHASRSPCGR